MNKEKDNLLVINKDSIFYKIKTFFIRILFKNRNEKVMEEKQSGEVKLSNSDARKNSFLEDVKIQENKELKELLYLQKLLKMGRIKEKDLSKKERIGLEKLYKQQIHNLNKSINNYKNKIISIRTKLTQNN